MRLLNTTTLALHTFFDKAVPDYAILSHRWEEEEVTFQDLQSDRGSSMPGFAKIVGCCAQAKSEGWEYVWVDSCCIDKSSSAELSEAINSMFKWYENARVCYAYLSDVNGLENILKQLEDSAWFTRGWTLQELLAPETVVFFDRNWVEIGTRSSLEDVISQITKIRAISAWQECCVAEKMSWASRRETTRVEDEAYCLMGLFDVNMPLLYGEGRKAFQRLQLEILKSTDDDSIFCWCDRKGSGDLLAPRLEAFKSSSEIRHCYKDDSSLSSLSLSSSDLSKRALDQAKATRNYFRTKPYPTTLSNKGLHISLFLVPVDLLDIEAHRFKSGIVFAAIFQGLRSGVQHRSPAVLLRRTIHEDRNNDIQNWTCSRISSDQLFTFDIYEVRSKCEAWIEKLRPPIVSKFLPASESDDRYPKSRIIYVKGSSRNSTMCNSAYDARYDILIDTRLLQARSFEISRPVPFIEREDQISSNMLAWNEQSSSFQLTFRAWTHRGPHYFHSYFTNHKTKETLLYIVFVDPGRVSLALLKLDTVQEFKNLTIPSLLDERTTKVGHQAFGVDRVSVWLNDRSTVFASIQRTSAVQGIRKYAANFVVEDYGPTLWLPPSRYSSLISYLAQRIADRDKDTEALQKYSRAQRQGLKY
ncbi:hypothetical protein ONS95_010997 [Cadophora gregata]|uniref:uncharacterized protein n=1 Tax=Cadophora gregata TaxID=51156 RepID=UPI0026DA8453|nr:uncharacterized protein ONS95_010997 [Cadophora gregata]KAK0119557.1 hypothetical protein ONS95_010997 [Cadophora gregata]